ncbi:unnamed protein product [Diatraea saccharalis]|uniref:Uncharacterized protein n=1 Tax=Diatraea saccharalis TaxID=40085 RepID=A0A9N9W5P5_9NEOP|nr:unnamed protein product [Diatraea saccharalis]
MTEREHRSAKRKWKTANKKHRERQKTAQQIMDITPTSSPRSGTPVLPRSRGRKQIRRDRSAVPFYIKPPSVSRREICLCKIHTNAQYILDALYKTRVIAHQNTEGVKQGTMLVHQVFTDTPGELQYRDLSCFCQRGFCSCMSPKTYHPVPAPVIDTLTEGILLDGLDEEIVLDDILYIITVPRRTFYNTVYSTPSSSDDEFLASYSQPSVSNIKERQLIKKENIHPTKISDGVHVLVKVSSVKDKHYTYLRVAKSEVDEEGDVKIMFHKTVDKTGKRFKAVDTDISYEPYDNILEIVPNPKIVVKDDEGNLGEEATIDLDEIASNDNLNVSNHEEGMIALRQLPAPLYALDTMYAVLSIMSRSIAIVETANKRDILKLTSKTSVDQEYKTKYRELIQLTSCMDDAVRFIKNKSCRQTKAVFTVINKSLPVLELHMSEIYLNDVADILLKKTKDFNMADLDWNLVRSIALQLMAHNVEWVRAKFYSEIAEMVKFVLIGDDLNQSENEKCLMLLCDVEVSATNIMLYLLRGRLALSDSGWWRLLASLLPVLPLLHVYAEHNTQLELDIASCMGVSLAEVVSGLVRLLFVRCVAVQLDAAHELCLLLDDERYLPPKEALRADVLMNALKRVQPQDFNVDSTSSPTKNPQIAGLLQILDVLKQDIVLDEHGTEYVTRETVQPTLEPSLRRSTLQQLAVLLRQQECHDAMSLMVNDYLAYPECAISCVSVLNSVCFAGRHSLAKVTDLPTLLLRVILVFPANDSAVLMSAQVLALIAWSGFTLQELDSDRKRVPALPHCVTLRTVLPFNANSYWNTSTQRVAKGAAPPPAPLLLQPTNQDRALLKASSPQHTATSALLALENATSHAQVIDALSLLESYVRLLPLFSTSEEFASLPWQHVQRFLRAPPASSRDIALLVALMHFVISYMDSTPKSDGIPSWVKSSLIDSDMTVLSILSRDQLLPQQNAQESIEVTQLHIHIVKILQRCVKRLQYEDYDTGKLESLLKIMVSCLERIDLKNFHVLGINLYVIINIEFYRVSNCKN